MRTESRVQDLTIAETLERAVQAGQDSVRRGPELLAELRDAGVVDAGGHALTIILAGVIAVLRGEEPPELDHYAPARISHPQHSSSTYRYCTNFAVTGQGLAPGAFTEQLEGLGDSLLIVGDSTTLKVHIHTDVPEDATSVFDDVGEISHLDIADMRLQVAARDERLGAVAQPGVTQARMRCGALAVVSGDGLAEMFVELGAHTLDGGPTLNPSTYELLAGIHEVAAEEVVVLPGSANVIMAAERAAELSDKEVRVVAATSQQAGLHAAVALMPQQGVAANAGAMEAALERLRTGAVAPAARDDARGRFSRGEAVGFLAEEPVAWGEPGATLHAVLQRLAEGTELISVFSGDEAPLDFEQIEGMLDGDLSVELELRQGGQPAYWWLLAAE